jgi:hypothetical protein
MSLGEQAYLLPICLGKESLDAIGARNKHMWAVSRFLFLLGLLVIDWYFDTSFGQSPLDGPMSSTASLSQSPIHKQQSCKKLEVLDIVASSPHSEAAASHFSALHSQGGKAGAFVPMDAVLAYVFMSMQC